MKVKLKSFSPASQAWYSSLGDAGEAGHLLLGKAHDLPHGADALGHLGELGFQVGLFHDERFPFLAKSNQNQNKKSVSKEKFSFETDCMIRGTTQIALTRPSSGSNKPYALTQHTRETPTTHGFGLPARKGSASGAPPLARTARQLSERGKPRPTSSQPLS